GGRAWSQADIASLSILAEMLASAWRRERQTNELVSVLTTRELAIRQQAALTEGTRLLLTQELENPLTQTLSLVMTALDGDVAYVEMFEVDDELGMVSRPIEHLYRDPATRVESVTWPLSSSPVAAERYLAGLPNVFASPQEEASNDPDHVEHYEESALAAECNYPIITEGKTIGFVGVGTFAERSWTADDRSVMHSFALMLGAYIEREAAMRKLEDLVSAKDRFIGAVSHELRTPLAVVVGLAAELEDNHDTFTRKERQEFLGMIRRQSTEVSDIIDDLLVSTRISETGLTVIAETFKLDDLARAVLRDLPEEVTDKVVDVDLTPTEVVADPLRTRQIVRNLITNAHRYGGEHISIEVRAEGDRTILAVADDGEGVPEERRADVFEAYHTSGGERIVTAAIGLGLTVSRQLARLMGGDVTYVHSDHPRFELELLSSVAEHESDESLTVPTGI
ncbi:MAG: GAF domain-containing sensor histidine kinase, partial [Acidimicrobiia bacterium]|nr:GAF domain-containing sensor histidine kinase [Acidimicrobiia bacterium]